MPALPVDSIGKLVALGGAFSTHAADERPTKWPDLWVTADETRIGPNEAIELPPEVSKVTVGPEITAVIGDSLWRASETEAANAVKGFTITNDVTAKGEWPGYSNENHEFITGVGYKIFPTFRPVLTKYAELGADEIDDRAVKATVDGETVVSGTTADMSFTVAELVAHASKIVKLNENDLLALGDPGSPTGYIDDADKVTCEIEGVGELTNSIVRLKD